MTQFNRTLIFSPDQGSNHSLCVEYQYTLYPLFSAHFTVLRCNLPETVLSFRHCLHPRERVEAAIPKHKRAGWDVLFSLSFCCSSWPLCMGLTLNSCLQFSPLMHKPCKYCSILSRENGSTLGSNRQRFGVRMLKSKCTCL